MKGHRRSVVLFVLAACSAPAKQDATAPSPPSGDPNATAPATPTPAEPTSPPPAPPPTTCPSLQIKAPDAVSAGEVGRVTLIVTDPGGTPTYRWTVSAGTIESGQGTTTISVGTKGLGGSSLTTTVELGGLPEVCAARSASATFLVGA